MGERFLLSSYFFLFLLFNVHPTQNPHFPQRARGSTWKAFIEKLSKKLIQLVKLGKPGQRVSTSTEGDKTEYTASFSRHRYEPRGKTNGYSALLFFWEDVSDPQRLFHLVQRSFYHSPWKSSFSSSHAGRAGLGELVCCLCLCESSRSTGRP